MFCPECGTIVESINKVLNFCYNCGYNVGDRIKKNRYDDYNFNKPYKNRYIIDSEILNDVCEEIIRDNNTINSISSIGLFIGNQNFNKVVRGQLSLSEYCFNGLVLLYGKYIPYRIKVGNSVKITLYHNEIIAEIVAIILGDGNLYYRDGNYRLDIALNGVKEWSYVLYVKKLLFSVFEQDPRIVWIRNLKSAKGDEKGVNLQLTNKAVVESLLDLGLKSGSKTKNQVEVPEWIKSNNSFKLSALKGLIDTDGHIGVEKGDKSIRIRFVNASKNLVKDFSEMSNSLGFRTGSILGPYEIFDKRTGNYSIIYSVNINAKDQVKKFLNNVEPEKWKNNRRSLGNKLMILYDIGNIDEAISEAFRYKRNFYSKEYAEYLKDLWIELGSSRKVNSFLRDINKKIPRESIENFVEKLFNEFYQKEYGKDCYKRWIKYNSNILIDIKLNKITKFPYILKQEFAKIISYKLEDLNDDDLVLEEIRKLILKMDLNHFIIDTPTVRLFERVCFLWNSIDYENILNEFFINLIRFVREVSYHIEYPGIVSLHRRFCLLGEQKLVKKLYNFVRTLG